MSYEFYKIAHIVGLLIVFIGLGGAVLGRRRDGGHGEPPRAAGALHGIGLVVMLVAGFGTMARLQIAWPWPGWLFAKLGLWILIGALPVLARKGAIPRSVAWLVAVALGGLAAWLAITKPF